MTECETLEFFAWDKSEEEVTDVAERTSVEASEQS